jgi:hypothetical protein
LDVNLPDLDDAADTLNGGIGDDLVYGGNGADTLLGDAGNDRIYGAQSNDALGGGTGSDQLYGGSGNDNIDGGAGNDVLLGGIGADRLNGGAGNDRIDGAQGTDNLSGGAGDDQLYGGSGSDNIDSGAGNDALLGGIGADRLDGGAGNDTISGGDGNDALLLSSGVDILDGGAGTDSLEMSGNFSTYTIFGDVADGYSFTNGDGTTTAVGVETYSFNNITYSAAQLDELVPCYASGTRILTDKGEVAVQDLRVGDMVITVSEGKQVPQPIRWIGHRRAKMAGHPAPGRVQPVLIRAGALGQGVPHRDLRVSPEHSMWLDGMLVQASFLVNGRTILRDTSCHEVTYYHLELDAHSVLLAEGAEAESYMDNGNRSMFANGPLVMQFPDFAPKEGRASSGQLCGPWVEDPRDQRLCPLLARLKAIAMMPSKAAGQPTMRPVADVPLRTKLLRSVSMQPQSAATNQNRAA